MANYSRVVNESIQVATHVETSEPYVLYSAASFALAAAIMGFMWWRWNRNE